MRSHDWSAPSRKDLDTLHGLEKERLKSMFDSRRSVHVPDKVLLLWLVPFAILTCRGSRRNSIHLRHFRATRGVVSLQRSRLPAKFDLAKVRPKSFNSCFSGDIVLLSRCERLDT